MSEAVRIKADPEAPASPFGEDVMDESTDLEFYDKNLQGDTFGRMYLARLPRYVWEAWSTLDDDEEIQIGRIRQWQNPDGTTKLQMLLRDDLPQHRELPKEYNMELANPDVYNTFVFTEQDFAAYAAKNKEKAAQLAKGIPAHLLRQQQQKMQEKEKQPYDRSKRNQPYTRKSIPKRTAIAGTIKHEVICTPLRNAETDAYLSDKAFVETQQAQASKMSLHVGRMKTTLGANEEKEWGQFIRAGQQQPSKAKKMENKTARWPYNELMDAISACFSQYKYWSMKSLRAKIPQPEAYIREALEQVAVLSRSGVFANSWSLKEGYSDITASQDAAPEVADAAPGAADDMAMSDDDEDEDVKMEDVL
ncbi:transcription initiation factor IIF, beta subunit-domain-containing protein [Apodospora peruviana]|uniref:Transcription initiation factor IIF subunit beta n=1 Tax=Apodospora peruviana TaxID=516989 RepID=A0AAE0MFP7_9PEZI|nr:transcription initiation factor IIF, beta subunit-domain-containing protein [Apodospora peruviana]